MKQYTWKNGFQEFGHQKIKGNVTEIQEKKIGESKECPILLTGGVPSLQERKGKAQRCTPVKEAEL